MANSKPVVEGTVIMAEDQYAGRGQQQNQWHAEPGKNLTFSLLLIPSFLNPAQQFEFNKVISLAVAQGVENACGQPIHIKWPNDIYWGDKKLGGILIENTLQGQRIKNSVVGIGINVNQQYFPPEAPNAASVWQILQTDYDLHALLSDICRYIEAFYLRLKAGDSASINQQYIQRLYWLNEPKQFMADGKTFDGTIIGVRDDGFLLLNTESGAQAFNFKEIQFLNKQTS